MGEIKLGDESMSDAKRVRKKKESVTDRTNVILDSYESWLSRQPVKRVRAKTGYISASETEEATA